MKNRNSSTSTTPNSLSSSFSSANNVCTFNKHNKDDITTDNTTNAVTAHTKQQTLSKEEEEILNNKNILKVAIIGGKGVGKTSFLLKVLNNKFEKLYIPTIDIEKRTKIINNEGKQYTFYFIVTPGDSIYKSNYSMYFQKANFICIFYDMSDVDSFNEAKQLFFNDIRSVIQTTTTTTHINVIGNKKDIANSKVLQSQEIKRFCEENKVTSYEISVKSGIGMKVLMNDICNTFDVDKE
jgi:small GTP-binding protein